MFKNAHVLYKSYCPETADVIKQRSTVINLVFVFTRIALKIRFSIFSNVMVLALKVFKYFGFILQFTNFLQALDKHQYYRSQITHKILS